MKMPLDWPRINQFPEWFTVQREKDYTVYDLRTNSQRSYTGEELQEGIAIVLQPGAELGLLVKSP